MLVLLTAWPLARLGESFFTAASTGAWTPPVAPPTVTIGREFALLATQKLLVAMLLAVPLWHAASIRPWARRWMHLALTAAVLWMLVLLVTRLVGGDRSLPAPSHARQLIAALAAIGCWLFGLAWSGWLRWRGGRRLLGEADGNAPRRADPDLLLAILAAIVLLAVVALALVALGGPLRWVYAGPFIALAVGILVLLLARGWLRLLGPALILAAVARVGASWPGDVLARALARGGAWGWSDFSPLAADYSGLLWMLQWRGWVGVLILLSALGLAAWMQFRCFRGAPSAPARTARIGAAAGCWVFVAGWLIGPAHIGGAAMLFALALAVLSLGPAEGGVRAAAAAGPLPAPLASPPIRPAEGARPACGFFLLFALLVVYCYALLGLSPMLHDPLWLSVDQPGGDKVLHGVWGIYVTLACCLGLAPLGRWTAAAGGLMVSAALAVAGELAQAGYLPDRRLEAADALAHVAAGALVAAILLLAPFRWRGGHPG
jgi:hypothetical protein